MIDFIKQLYFTGFAIIFNNSRASKRKRTSGAVAAMALIESLFLIGVASWIDISIGERFWLSPPNSLFHSKLMIAALFFLLYFANYRVIVSCGHGIKFAHEFPSLEKGRRVLLITCCCVLAVFTLIWFIWWRLVYRHFFHIVS